MDWWSEIKRRGVAHVAGLYGVTAWLIVQMADVVSQGPFPMPSDALRLIWMALVLVFPIALIFGWRYDITRRGIVRTDPHVRAGTDLPLNQTDRIIVAGLSLLIVVILVGALVGVRDAIQQEQPDQDVAAEVTCPP
jgi:hypothetical protein